MTFKIPLHTAFAVQSVSATDLPQITDPANGFSTFQRGSDTSVRVGAWEASPFTPLARLESKGMIPLFREKSLSPLKVGFTDFNGIVYAVSLQVPAEAQTIVLNEQKSATYWTQPLPEGGVHYLLRIDGTGESVLPSGAIHHFSEGVFGFQGRPGALDFQSRVGKDAATGEPIRAPESEYFAISKALGNLAVGRERQWEDFWFLRQTRDGDLAEAVFQYVLALVQKVRKDSPLVNNGRAPFFSVLNGLFHNLTFDKAVQKKRLQALIEADSESLSYVFLDYALPLATQEAIWELANEVMEPSHQRNTNLSDGQKEMAMIHGVRLLGYLRPYRTLPALNSEQQQYATRLLLLASKHQYPGVRTEAYSALNSHVYSGDLDPAAFRFLVKSYLPQLVSEAESKHAGREAKPDLEEIVYRIRAEEQMIDGCFQLEAVEGFNLNQANVNALWGSLARQLRTLKSEAPRFIAEPVKFFEMSNSRALYIAMLAAFRLPLGDVPYTSEQEEYVSALLEAAQTLRLHSDDRYPLDILASAVVNRRDGSQFAGSRDRLRRLADALYPAWLDRVHPILRAEVDPGRIPAALSPVSYVTAFEIDVKKLATLTPPFSLLDRLEHENFAKEERIPQLRKLLEVAALEFQRPFYALGSHASRWAEAAILFAKRYGLESEFLAWLDQQTPHLPKTTLLLLYLPKIAVLGPDARQKAAEIAIEALDSANELADEDYEQFFELLTRLQPNPDTVPDLPLETFRRYEAALVGRTIRSFSSEEAVVALPYLGRLGEQGRIPQSKQREVALFYANAFGWEPFPHGLFEYATAFQAGLRAKGVTVSELDLAIANFKVLGQFPSHRVISPKQFHATIVNSPGIEERRAAAENAKFIYLNREFLNQWLEGKPFDPSRDSDWKRVLNGLGIGMHDHAKEVAEESARSLAYAQYFIAPYGPEGEMKPMLLLRTPPPVSGRPHPQSDFQVILMDFGGHMTDKSADAVRETLTKLPVSVTKRFIGAEAHPTDLQRHGRHVLATANADGRTGTGKALRYTMRLYGEISVDTSNHEVLHPLKDALSSEDQRYFAHLHRTSSNGSADFAEAYGMTNADEDWSTLGEWWIRDSYGALRQAVDLALRGYPRRLQKLMVFLKYYSQGSPGLPMSRIDDEGRIHMSYVRFEKNGLGFPVRIDSMGYNFQYSTRELTGAQGGKFRDVHIR